MKLADLSLPCTRNPKALGGGDPSEPRNKFMETLTSGMASVVRLPFGVEAQQRAPSPPPPEQLVLYEFEACPFCRRVREALVDLDLSVTVRPCPKGAQRHRREVLERGGKEVFPFLVDEAAGVSLYESQDIVDYLYTTYGPEGAKASEWLCKSTPLTGACAASSRRATESARMARARTVACDDPTC